MWPARTMGDSRAGVRCVRCTGAPQAGPLNIDGILTSRNFTRTVTLDATRPPLYNQETDRIRTPRSSSRGPIHGRTQSLVEDQAGQGGQRRQAGEDLEQ